MEETVFENMDNITEDVINVMPEDSMNLNPKIVAVAFIVGAVACAAASAASAIYKNRDKLDEIRIKRLEKKGYVVHTPSNVIDMEQAVEFDYDDSNNE